MSKQNNYHIVEGGGNSSFRVAKTLCLAASLLFFLNFSNSSVSAQEIETKSPKTEIIQNIESGTVSIVIDGKTVGFFTKDGLHVMGDIIYSGTIRDAGDDVQKIIDKNQSREGADEEIQ